MIFLGSIVKPKSYLGMIKVSNVPLDIMPIEKDKAVYIGFSEKFAKKYTVKEWNNFGKTAEVMLYEISNDSDVKKLSEQGIFIEDVNVKYKDQNDFRTDEIIDCEVYDTDRNYIGKVKEIWKLPGNDVWLLDTKKGDLPIPVIDEVIKNVKTDDKLIVINMILGLSDLTNNDGDKDA